MRRKIQFAESLSDILRRPLLLPTTDLPTEASRGKILYSFRPYHNPDWFVFIRSSHTSAAVFRWLTAKSLLMRLSRDEEDLYTLLAVEKDFNTRLISLGRTIISKTDLRQGAKVHHELKDRLLRILNGYLPRIHAKKAWKGRTKIPEKRVVGVGYRDKGSISTAPAWQDQILGTEEVSSDSRDEVLRDLYSLLSFLVFLQERTGTG